MSSEQSEDLEFELVGRGHAGDIVEVVPGKRHSGVRRVRSKLVVDSINRISSNSRARGLSCAIDENGNVYVLGQFFENMFADNIHLTTAESGIFLAQIGNDGKWKWATTLHNHSSANDVTMSCEIVYQRKFLYTAMVIANAGTAVTEGFVIKTNRSGNIIWSTRFTGDLEQHIRLSVDRNSNVYIVNSYTDKLVLTDKIKLPVTNLEKVSDSPTTVRGYVAKLNRQGVWIWARDISGDTNRDNSNLNDIVTTPDGNSYVVGWFIGTVILDDIKIKGSKRSIKDFILAEIGPAGNWIRAEAFPNGEGTGVDIDRKGNLYIVGGFIDQFNLCGAHIDTCEGIHLFVTKIDCKWRTDWVISTEYNSDLTVDIANANIVVDKKGNAYVDGLFNRPISFNQILLVPKCDEVDEFIVKISKNGSILWLTQISGNEISTSRDLCIDNWENLYITGGFSPELIIGDRCSKNKDHQFAPLPTLYLVKFKPILPRLIGIISRKNNNNRVLVNFKGDCNGFDDLDGGQDYYVDNYGHTTLESHYRYLGTAIGSNRIFIP